MKSIYQRFVRRTLFVILLGHLAILSHATNYYISNSGNDANTGLSDAQAWKTIVKVNSITYAAGDSILFKSGQYFDDTYMYVTSSGSVISPIVISTYGGSVMAELRAYGEIYGWTNSANWTIHTAGVYKMTVKQECNRLWLNGKDSKESQTLTLDSNHPWRCEGTTLYVFAPSNPASYYHSIVNAIKSKTTDQSVLLSYAIRTSGASNVTITNIRASGGAESTIRIANSKNILVENCEIGNKCNFYGVTIIGTLSNDSTDNVIIRNNTIATGDSLYYEYFRTYHSTYEGVYIKDRVTNCKVHDNYFNSWSHTAVDIENFDQTLSPHDIEVYNNFITAPLIDYARGLTADYISGYNISFHHNTVLNTSVRCQFNGNGLKVYDNIFDGTRGCPYPEKPNVGNAIAIEGYNNNATNMEIYNNIMTNCANSAIFITWYNTKQKAYNKIHDNNIFNNNSTNGYQFWIDNNDPANSINHNTYSNNHLYKFGTANLIYTRTGVRTVTTFNGSTPCLGDLVVGNDTLLTFNVIGVGKYITNAKDLIIEHNENSVSKTVALNFPMIDLKGKKYASSVTLLPYTSLVLMKDLSTVQADLISPVVTAFTIPATSTLLAVSISALIASDNIGVIGYLLTETSTKPSAGAIGWSSIKPTTYVFSSLGAKSIYAWAKDAAGNVSTSIKASVTISSPVASTFTFTGSSSGSVNSASSNFTVTPNNLYTGTITITPTGTGSTGLSAKVLSFSNSSASQTFTITPTVAGSITLTPTNNGTLTNPANITYLVNAAMPNAPTSVVATSGDASASVTFVAPTNTGGSVITGYTVTSIPAGGIDANAGSTALTHTIIGLTNGTSYTFTVKATNSVGSSVASVASNPVIPVVASVIIKQGEIIPSHFITVWQGLNGLNQMNINVVSATLEDLPLSVDDEIAVFSGSACVGASKLTKSIISSDNTTFVTILASQNDGSGNGFTDNDTIVFKIWNNKTQKELQINSVVYHSGISTWKTNGRYSPASTAVVKIASYQVYTQSIELLKGYNMISTYVSAQNPNVSVVTKTLVDQGNLIKMQDETGNSLENWGDFGGWINQLGSLEETEGYKIQVANNCTLQVTGRSVAMPFDIALKTGWNIISFPRTDVVNAMNVFQSLIDQNKLIKVQDEAGNSIENWGLFGGWKNGIGNFIPGKAYKVKMSADAVLTFQESYPKSAIVLAKSEQTEYYHSSVEGNGTDHMNINVTGLNNIGLSVGDELAAFDGAVCVATTKITEADLLSGSACLASSFSTDTQNPNGFKVGDPIQISIWNKLSGDESKVNAEVITGQLKYEKNASVLINMKSAILATGLTNLDNVVKIDVFPNPCQGRVTVRFSEIPEENSQIEISDISGRKLISRIVSGTSEEFNLDSFTPGLYLVKSILGKNEYVQKLIVNK